jgi:hypothetical protein
MAARRLALAATVLAFLGGPAAGNAAAACTAPVKSTAYEDTSQNDSEPLVEDTKYEAQSFRVPANVELNKVSLYMGNFGDTTDSVTAEIRRDVGGEPSVEVLGTRTRTIGTTVDTFQDFDFSADRIGLIAGTSYFIVLRGGTAGQGNKWGSDQSSPPYLDGFALYSSNGGTSWNDAGRDMLFQVFGQTCTADATPVGGGVQGKAAVSSFGMSPSAFAAAPSGPSAITARKRKAPVGTRVRFTLNQAASVAFKVTRRVRGRRVKRGKRRVCVKPTRKNRGKKRCKRTVTLKGGFTVNGAAGSNSFSFTGRLRGRRLKPGRYRLVATPSAGGVKGSPISTAFRIVK